MDNREIELLHYWESNILNPLDPQRERWKKLLFQQVPKCKETQIPLIERFIDVSNKEVLDVGCQLGALAIALSEKGATVTGIDVEEKTLQGARIRSSGYGVSPTFCKAYGESLPFADGSFDLVTMMDVIEHVEDINATLTECARVLKKGGLFILQGPNRWSPRWFVRDPHYQMFGISVLPQKVGRWYVTKVRGLPSYDVGVFPVALQTQNHLKSLGLRIELGAGIRERTQRGPIFRIYEGLFKAMFTIVAVKDV
jgi:2-polyprenyl-3-methyl-5-hydroxy-6-metoxy-1,4-benzoquinol methylase